MNEKYLNRIVANPSFQVDEIDSRLFGSFVEHMGRGVYGGIYEQDSKFSNQDGFRQDVLDLVKELGVTIVRYPGGNFLSGYDWKDGVGPKNLRPNRLDLAWHSMESNEFGLDEFMRWCEQSDVEPMMALNLGTGNLRDALELLEYTNNASESLWADLRAKNGKIRPYNVKVWCLGNEMDGPWQLGHKSALDYGKLAADVARGMRQVDKNLELVICGSSGRGMATFGTWEDEVLNIAYDLVDYISIHIYVEENDDLNSFLACSSELDKFIEEVVSIADSVKSRKRSNKKINLSVDEWNVWRLSEFQKKEAPKNWDKAPRLIEDEYTVADAVVVGNLLISLLRHADRVKMACMAQLVNVIAPIRTEKDSPAWRQTIFYPFSLTSKYGRGVVLDTKIQSATIFTEKFGYQNVIDGVVIYNKDLQEVVIFCVNRDACNNQNLEITLEGFPLEGIIEQATLSNANVYLTNTVTNPLAVVPDFSITAEIDKNRVHATLSPVSWQMFRVKLKTGDYNGD
jgi:alpha-N-arabinofuranosidase